MASGIFKTTMTVGSLTMLSRILGFVRDMLIARLFGVDSATDAFFVSFKIPNFLRRLFTEGAFTHAFIPVLMDYDRKDNRAALPDFIDKAGGCLALLMMGLSLLGMVAAPILIVVFAPGFLQGGDQYQLSVQMLRIMMPYLFFIACVAFAGSILNAQGRFAAPAFAPVLLNVCMIVGAVWIAPMMAEPITALAWSVLLAGFLQLISQFPVLRRLGLWPRLRWGFDDDRVKRVLLAMGPAVFGVSVTQINLLLDTFIASFLETGSVSWLYYSDRLVEFPLGILGVAVSTAILPRLAKDHAAEDRTSFAKGLVWGLKLTGLVGLPASVGLTVLAEPIVSVLFQSDEFSAVDVRRTGQSLKAYAAGLTGFMAVKVLAPGFSSRKDLATPVRYGLYSLGINMVFNLLLVWPLGHAGLALATSLAAFGNAGLLWMTLSKQGVLRCEGKGRVFVLRVLFAAGSMAAVLIHGADAGFWQELSGFDRVLYLFVWIAAGALVYVAALWLAGMRPGHLR